MFLMIDGRCEWIDGEVQSSVPPPPCRDKLSNQIIQLWKIHLYVSQKAWQDVKVNESVVWI